MKSGKDNVFDFRPDVISFTWRGKKICHAWQAFFTLFFLCSWKRIFAPAFWA